jgi:hypothetical protein
MKIDHISKQIISIALYLDSKVPGIVSEIWIDENIVKDLKSTLPRDNQINELIEASFEELNKIENQRRRQYLKEILSSLKYQIETLNKKVTYSNFSQQAFGFRIERVKDQELHQIEAELSRLEKKTGLTRQEMFKKHELPIEQYEATFKLFVEEAKTALPKFVTDFPDEGFIFEVVTDKPWGAFNSHIAPFKSKLTLNSDTSFTKLSLYRLAFHEAYGGHHSELSHKDLMLVQQERGEHGLIITFSPQTFVSEAIAEGIYVLQEGLDKDDHDHMAGWYYSRLIFALQNAATFWFFDDGLSREEIKSKLSNYAVSNKTAENILNFSTDKLFGKYAPVYYSAFNFIQKLYEGTDQKEKLIKTLFTKPCTTSLLTEEFGK